MKTTVPIDIRAQFEEALGREKEVWAVSSSRNRAGDPGETWVVATKTRLLIGDRGFGGPVSIRETRIRDVTGVEIEGSAWGAGRAVLTGKSGAIDHVWFSSLERDECSQLGRRILEKSAELPVAAPIDLGEMQRKKAVKKTPEVIPEAAPAPPPARRPDIPPRTGRVPPGGALDLFLDRPFAVPGEPLTGVLRLCWPAAKPVRGVRLAWLGTEQTHAKVGAGKSRRTVRSAIHWVNELIGCWGERYALSTMGSFADALSGNTWESLPAGEHLWPFEFRVPNGAPAAYAGAHVDVIWKLSAQVDIPRGFDLMQDWSIRVIPPGPGHVLARHGARKKSVKLDLWIDEGPAGPDAEVRGRFRVQNIGGKTIRAAHVEVVRLERAVAAGHVRETQHVESRQKFRGSSIGEEPVEFTVRLPASFCPWEGKYSSLAYGVKVWLDVAWGFDVEVLLRTP